VSPARTSFRTTSSSLWSVARETVVPASTTGSSSATGVKAPVRPTCTAIALTIVVACSAGYLNATAQRGNLDVTPASACSARSSSFTTAPSIWYGRSSRRARNDAIASRA